MSDPRDYDDEPYLPAKPRRTAWGAWIALTIVLACLATLLLYWPK
jgi:hypothetical protein